eukprot:TRINITY_DN71664_c0_g1_i1.p1 TRINITY_DN71664_c0_g1~~TRINITY_DN71664_c0_g1_i1.p1  ORF type:complete len:269 (+),score=112.96 TRINITY_DN71664_c0_g1_i1:86-808(+)
MAGAEQELWLRIRRLEAMVGGPEELDEEREQHSDPAAVGSSPPRRSPAASSRAAVVKPKPLPLTARVKALQDDFMQLQKSRRRLVDISATVISLRNLCAEALEEALMGDEAADCRGPGEPSHAFKLRCVLGADPEQHKATGEMLKQVGDLKSNIQFKGLADLTGHRGTALKLRAEQESRQRRVAALQQRASQLCARYREAVAAQQEQYFASALLLSQWEEAVDSMLREKGLPPLEPPPED